MPPASSWNRLPGCLPAVPHALRYSMNRGPGIRDLLVPLMDKETNLFALADYCGLAAADKEGDSRAGPPGNGTVFQRANRVGR